MSSSHKDLGPKLLGHSRFRRERRIRCSRLTFLLHFEVYETSGNVEIEPCRGVGYRRHTLTLPPFFFQCHVTRHIRASRESKIFGFRESISRYSTNYRKSQGSERAGFFNLPATYGLSSLLLRLPSNSSIGSLSKSMPE